jgi:hypothetical protein
MRAGLDMVNTLDDALRLSKNLAASGEGVPTNLRGKGPDILAIVLAGREIGVPPMMALRSLSIDRGKVSLSAELMLMKFREAGGKHRWLALGDAGEARLRLELPGHDPQDFTYTKADAERAGLLNKKNRDGTPGVWQKHTANMLRWRCVSNAISAYAPEVLGPALYTPDELAEIRGDYDQPRSGPKPTRPEEPAEAPTEEKPDAEPTKTEPTGPDWVMDAGRHQGKRLGEVDIRYLELMCARLAESLEHGRAQDPEGTRARLERFQAEVLRRQPDERPGPADALEDGPGHNDDIPFGAEDAA